MNNNSLHAELIGDNLCTTAGFAVTAPAPVLALCRQLIAAGFDPATPLECYRVGMLAVKVRSIGKGARLTVKDNRLGRPVFARCQDASESDAAASLVAFLVPPPREIGVAS